MTGKATKELVGLILDKVARQKYVCPGYLSFADDATSWGVGLGAGASKVGCCISVRVDG